MKSLLLTLLLAHGEVDSIMVLDGYIQGHKFQFVGESIPSRNREDLFYLDKKAALSFREMHAQAAKEGIELKVRSAFRTNRQQKQLKKRRGDLAAPPGYSNHQGGTAVDLEVERKISKENVSEKILAGIQKHCREEDAAWVCPTVAYWWLNRNAHHYGFKQTLSHEKWHWVYTGDSTDSTRTQRD